MTKAEQIGVRYKKLFYWIIGGLGILLALVLIFALLAPKLINLEPLRQKAIAVFHEKTGGRIDYQRVDLSFLPRPCVTIHQANLSIPDKGKGTLKSIQVYPRVFPLLKGQIRFAEIEVEEPDFTMPLPAMPENLAEKGASKPGAEVEEVLAGVLAPLALEMPDLIVEVKKGKLNLSIDERPLFSFERVDARLVFPPSGFKVSLNCTSNLWEKMALEGTLGLEPLKASGRIDFSGFQAHKVSTYLFPQAEQSVSDSDLNLTLIFNMDGLLAWQADLVAPLFRFTFHRGETKTVLLGKDMKALFSMDGTKTSISLSEVQLDQPKLALYGKFLMDRPSQKVNAELEGREVDVSSVREAALAMAGHMHDVQEIFEVVRGGTVPGITCRAQGSSLSDLGDLENIFIEGRLLGGRIFVPDVGLDLAEVQGDAVISGGVLEGENLEARFGNSWGRQGRLKLGLEGDDAPFHLDIAVDADLAELPPVLKTLINNRDFMGELDLLEKLEGRALGRLMLGESTAAIDARVDVSELDLKAQYKRVPYPIEIKRGNFLYDEGAIAVENLGGSFGKSAFSQLTARIDWKKQPHFEVQSGACQIVFQEIFPWVTSFEGLSVIRENYKVPKGMLDISAMKGKGLLLEPASWQFRAGGSFKDVVLDMSSLPDALKITNGKFTAVEDLTKQKATFNDLEIRFLDASLKASGALNDYLKGQINGDMTFTGDFDAKAIAWLSELARIPDVLDFRMPLSFSEGRFVWDKDGKIFFKGDATIAKGPQISAEMHLTPRRLDVEEVSIRDQGKETHMAFAFDYEEKALSLNFRGHLTSETINRLFVTNQFTNGWMKGDFKTHILLNDPAGSSAKGTLIGGDIIFPLALDFPLVIDSMDLNADGQHLRIKSAVCTWQDKRLALDGDVNLSPAGFDLDMNLATSHLDLNKINEAFGEDPEAEEQKQKTAVYDLPIQGIVNVKTDNLIYKDFNWSPFQAEVSLRQDKVRVSVTEADLCGISTPGVLEVSPTDYSLDFRLLAENQTVRDTADCLMKERVGATGTYTIKGGIRGQAKPEALAQALQGDLELLAQNGRIYQHVPMQRLFAFLNVTDLFRGRIPDMSKEGFPYNFITAKANLRNGKVIVDEWILDSPSMEVTGRGQVDYIDNTINMDILAAPLRVVDGIVRRIPVVRYITGGTLVSVAVRIEGGLDNPNVRTLPAAAVGEGLLGMMRRTLELPVRVIEPGRGREEGQGVPRQGGP